MKPKNFPGRKTLRRLVAGGHSVGALNQALVTVHGQDRLHYYTRDVKLRLGRRQRERDGAMTEGARPLQKKARLGRLR